jgi:hypothetical protein
VSLAAAHRAIAAKRGSGLLGVGALAAEMREMRVAIGDGDRFEFIGVHKGARWKFCFDVFTKYFVDMPMSGHTSSLRLRVSLDCRMV